MKTRPLILMIITLIIGIFIGVLASAELRHKRMRPVRIYTSERQMKEFIIRVLEPDEEQMNKLEPVFRKYGRLSTDLQKEFRKDFENLMDEYWNELKPMLNADQLKKLDEMENRRRDAVSRFSFDSLRNSRSQQGDGQRDRRDDSRFRRDRNPTRIDDTLHVNDSIRLRNRRPSGTRGSF